MSDPLYSEHDPSLVKVQLRPEVTHSLRSDSNETYVLVRDPVHSHFYRLGLDQWKLACLFDGTRTLRQLAAAAESTGESQVDANGMLRFAHWLVESKLAQVTQGSLKPQVVAQSDPDWSSRVQKIGRLNAWNPLFLKCALPDPQPLLRRVLPVMGWLFSSHTVMVALMLFLVGAYCIASQWSRFQNSLADVWAPSQWLQLLLVWVGLKVLHEIGHAVCCLRLGGRVTRWGLMFIMFSPIAWVDVTSAWAFRNKWHRIAVSSAGMYVEFLTAAIAAIIWANTSSPFIATLTRNVILSATLTSVLFNLNFLMRFDGYFILSDLVEIPNLYIVGQQYVAYVKRRYLLGLSASTIPWTGMRRQFVKVYGVAAFLWRWVFYVGIVLVASQLFHGAGLLLAIFSGVLWFGVPAVSLIISLAGGNRAERPSTFRLLGVGCVALMTLACLLWLPWPGALRAHGFVEFSPLKQLRADGGGFVTDVAVRSGDHVHAGQILARIENQPLHLQRDDLQLQIQVLGIQQRIMHRDGELAEYAAAEKRIASLQEHLAQLEAQIESLTLRAPIAGTVVGQDLPALPGSYLASGAELLSIGAAGEKEIRIAVPQQFVELYRSAIELPVFVRIAGKSLPTGVATLLRVEPKATRKVPHPALAANAGGPLAVQANSSDQDDDSMMLVEASFEAVIQLPHQWSDELHAGELCTVSLGRGQQRVYERLWSLGRSFLDRKLQPAG